MAKPVKERHFFDYSLLFTVLFITGFGLIMMYSASGYSAQNQWNDAMFFFVKQARFAAIGIALMLLLSQKFDYHWLANCNLFIYAFAVLLVALTMVAGLSSHGSARWFRLFGFSFQPSEVMKFAAIVMLSVKITNETEAMSQYRHAALTLLWGLVPAVVIAKNNLSTGLIVAGISFVLVFIASRKYVLFGLGGIAAVLIYVFAYQIAKLLEGMHLLKAYQLTRIFSWKDPGAYSDEAFQTLQGLYAIGSGGIFGKGLGESIQKFLMPEAQNDMIFTIICEELGLFGALSLMLVYGFIIYRMYDIARNAKDLFGSLLVIGIMAHISLQAILNIAVATNSIPNTGITLPFISYGGTSLLLLMAEVGICLNVSKQICLEE